MSVLGARRRRGARAHARAGRRGLRSLLAFGLVASGLAFVPGAATPAAGQAAEGVTSETSFSADCVGVAVGVRQPQTNQTGFTATAPATVEPGGTFTVRIAPKQGAFPDMQDSVIGPVPVHFLQNINMMFDLPANATVESAAVVPDSGVGIEGTPTVTINTTDHTPGRVVLTVPKVPKNPTPPTNETFFRLPAIELTLRATGDQGSDIVTRMAGTNEATSGWVFQASSVAMADVRCWPSGEVAAPAMSRTTITSGSTTIPTATTLTADPTRLPAGNEVTLRASVNAPAGAVRFTDGTTVLGLTELDPSGVATLTVPLEAVGDRSLTAHFLGTPGFSASSSSAVAVTVTDPSTRARVQITVAPTPAEVSLGTVALAGPTSVVVTATPVAGATGVPTGNVRLYRNDALVGTQPLVAGTTTFATTVTQGGYRFRAEYVGDTDFVAANGTAPVVTVYTPGDSSNTADQAVTGTVTLNDASGPLAAGSVLASSFRTDADGVQSLDGTLRFPATTLTIPGGSVTGQLALVGLTDGQIEAGADGEASLDARLFFQVHSADLGAGAQTFASGCAVGPFDVRLTGTRSGTDGALALTASRFRVPFSADGSCVTVTGESLASAVADAFAGSGTELSLTLTPPAAGASTAVDLDVTPDSGTPYGQQITMTATVTRADGADLPTGSVGEIYFYDGDTRLGRTVMSYANAGPAHTAMLQAPQQVFGSIVDSLPVGDHSLRAEFVPANGFKAALAASERSDAVDHEVTEAIDRTVPTIEVEVPASAPAGQPVDIDLHLDPAPIDVTGPAPLDGLIEVWDDAAPGGPARVMVAPSLFNQGNVEVTPTSTGTFSVQTALAPGDHRLRAVFVPDFSVEWYWAGAESDPVTHTVTGDRIPTSLQVVGDTTRGTGQVPVGAAVWAEVEFSPAAAATLGPLDTTVWYEMPNGTVSSGSILNGRGNVYVYQGNETPGPKSVRIWFEPGRAREGQAPAGTGNQGLASSETTFTYDVVTPGASGPTATAVRMLRAEPTTEGTASSEITAAVTFNAPGTIAYTARNVATGAVTDLGSAAVRTTTSSISGQGRARLSSPATTAALAAGAYEVSAAYTPTDPAVFAPSTTSEPMTLHVLALGESVPTATEIAVVSEGPAVAGQAVMLEATVAPADRGYGSVHWYDGDTVIATTSATAGRAGLLWWGFAEGEHDLRAVFESWQVAVIGSSESAPVSLTVLPAPEETSTSLAVSPDGSSDQGDEVTLTATIDPAEAVGEVVFSSGETELGRARPDEDGEATLTASDLAAGDHQLTAAFVPDDATAFAPSTSGAVAHTVTVPSVATTTGLAISPAGPSAEGVPLTLTATVSPAEAVGTVEFLDGATVVGSAPVASGTAALEVAHPAIGAHAFTARFVPGDGVAFLPSQSGVVDHTVEGTGEPEPPAMECRGADAATVALLQAILPSTGGVVQVDTPVTADVPESVELGVPSPVGFEWRFAIPADLAALAQAAGAPLSLTGIDGAIVSSGGASGRWAFPATAAVTDLEEPIRLEASGDVTATSLDPITYRVGSELAMTIAVALPGAPVNVPLVCTVTDEPVGSTPEVTLPDEGSIVATDADGNVIEDGALLVRGQEVTLVAFPYGADEEVGVVLNSTPRDLGAVPADADGVVTYLFTVPMDLEGGEHSLVFTGADDEHTFNFELAALPGQPGGPGGPGDGSEGDGDGDGSGGGGGLGGRLPRTGAVLLPLLAAGAALVVGGSGAVRAAGRRRRSGNGLDGGEERD